MTAITAITRDDGDLRGEVWGFCAKPDHGDLP